MNEFRREAGDAKRAVQSVRMEAAVGSGARELLRILRIRWDTAPPTLELRAWDGAKLVLPIDGEALAQEVERHLGGLRRRPSSAEPSPGSVEALMVLRAKEASPAALRSLFTPETWARITRTLALCRLMRHLATVGPGGAPEADEAARTAGLGPRTFRRQFVAIAGFSYRTLRARFRLAVVRRVAELHHSDFEDSARAVGYRFGSSASSAAIRATGRTLGGREPRHRSPAAGLSPR